PHRPASPVVSELRLLRKEAKAHLPAFTRQPCMILVKNTTSITCRRQLSNRCKDLLALRPSHSTVQPRFRPDQSPNGGKSRRMCFNKNTFLVWRFRLKVHGRGGGGYVCGFGKSA